MKLLIQHIYIDARKISLKITDNAYSPSIPRTIISDSERKMSKRLRKIRECIINSYISSWWMYISPQKDFEISVRQRITKVMEQLADRFKYLNYSQLIMLVIKLKVGMAQKAKSQNSMKKMTEVDPEKYFSRVLYEILAKLLEEEDIEIKQLREFLSDLLSVSVLVPFLDLLQSPVIIFNSVIALLAHDLTDISEYVTKIQKMKNKQKSGIEKDESILLPKFSLSEIENEVLNFDSFKDDDNNLNLTSSCKSNCKSSSENHPINVVSDICVTDTYKGTEKPGGQQFTLYIIEFKHVISNGACGISVIKKTAHRRYKEFISLHHYLSAEADYKGIKGPTSLDQMLLYNKSPAKISSRKEFLENYLRTIVNKPSLANLPVFQNFLDIGLSPFQTNQFSSTNLNQKIKKTFNNIFDKISDRFPDMSRESSASLEVVPPSNSTMSNNLAPVTKEGTVTNEDSATTQLDHAEEVNKLLKSLPKVPCHQNPAFPISVADLEYAHPLIQQNYRHLSDKYYLSVGATATSSSQVNPDDSVRHSTVRFVTTGPPQYTKDSPDDPVPFLLSFRVLAHQYRDSTCRNWGPDQGPVLTRKSGFHSRWEWLYWRILGVAADPIIQWSFEDLLRSSFVADYLELFQELLWPSGHSTKSLAKFVMNDDEESVRHLRQAASYSIVDAIPKIAYLFVDKMELADLIDAVLSDCQNLQTNRLFFFQLLQIIIEEHLFPDIFYAGQSSSFTLNQSNLIRPNP